MTPFIFILGLLALQNRSMSKGRVTSRPDIVLSANKTLCCQLCLRLFRQLALYCLSYAAVIHYSLVTALERSICSSFSLFALGTIPILQYYSTIISYSFLAFFPVDGFANAAVLKVLGSKMSLESSILFFSRLLDTREIIVGRQLVLSFWLSHWGKQPKKSGSTKIEMIRNALQCQNNVMDHLLLLLIKHIVAVLQTIKVSREYLHSSSED